MEEWVLKIEYETVKVTNEMKNRVGTRPGRLTTDFGSKNLSSNLFLTSARKYYSQDSFKKALLYLYFTCTKNLKVHSSVFD